MWKNIALDSISVMSFGHTRYIITAFYEVIKSFKLKNIEVNHIGISLDMWNSPEDQKSAEAYRAFDYTFGFLPRISNIKTSYWYTPNINIELKNSLPSIVDFMDNLIREFKPDVFLIGDDWGPIEVFVMEYLNWKKIPIVFLEHGAAVFNAKLTGNYQVRDKIPQDWKNKKYHLPQVNPSGQNAEYLICSYSEPSKNMMIKLGVKPSLIRGTGFPYFDRIYREKMKFVKKRVNNKKRILIISNGKGTFGGLFRKSAINYYKFLINIINIIQNEYDIFLRLKPGENIESFLESDMIQQLKDLKISFDDNTLESYIAIQKYDLVIGEMSTVLLESLILDIPIVLVSLDDDPLRRKQFDNRYFVKNIIGVLTISDASRIQEVVTNAFSEKYLRFCSDRLKENQDFHHKIDGRMSERVAQVIIEAIVCALITKQQFAEAYSVVIDGNKKFPESVESLSLEAKIKILLENVGEPEKLYEEGALCRDTEETFRRIKMLENEEKLEAASKAIELAVQKHPESLDLLNLQAELKVHTGNIQEGKKIFLEIIKRSPSHVDALNNLGVIEFHEGNLNSAIEFLKDALILDPAHESAISNLSHIQKIQKNATTP